MNDNEKKEVALFRFAVLGDLVHAHLGRGALRRALEKKSKELWVCPHGGPRRIAAKTIEAWLYAYRKHGLDGLFPQERSDKGTCKAIPEELQILILDMKREDPGRSVPGILSELQGAGLMRRSAFSASAVTRLLKSHGLSGPRIELETPARHRFVAPTCGVLWQGDACHGPKLFDPAAGREVRVKIFGLLDDKSRLITYLRAGFHERQEDFLRVLLEAVQRRGIPLAILLDNHGSFTGADVRLACAQLGIRLTFAKPRDGASKGKIERFWRTLRAQLLNRLDMSKVRTLDDLNVRLMTWVNNEYNLRPHAGLSGQTPLSVFEDDLDQIRFVDDALDLEGSFQGTVERVAKNDSTCTFRGKIYEVPPHLRGRKVVLHYKLLRPDFVWIEDGGVHVVLREVDVVANSRRSRTSTGSKVEPSKPRTGFNPIEDLLGRTLRPGEDQRKDDGEEGLTCAAS